MKLSEKNVTTIIIITTVLWAVINVLGWLGNAMLGMYLGVVLMLLYMILGIAKNGVVSKKFLSYPLIPWAIIWVISFYLADLYALKFTGVIPSFTVLGFHPSFASTIILYWIGGMLTLTLGFMVYRDEWLTKEDWDSFLKKIEDIKEEEKRGAVQ
ncbi:hypothetical protein [Tissierella sp. Yu-01]|uniref:hypothetical protein n=1 Tax=Tissierella sp. Yu-01 TaxID=3035694 RepID=UPI00240D340A|nr:hypothetical protein [Tissierella sp. Yu-01]WFA10040.1 hypothetical protein P3962_05660 [Tissierella sp. Yu-01]